MSDGIKIPPFDVDACRQIVDLHPTPPQDPETLERVWRHLLADHLAALEHIELQDAALQQKAAA